MKSLDSFTPIIPVGFVKKKSKLTAIVFIVSYLITLMNPQTLTNHQFCTKLLLVTFIVPGQTSRYLVLVHVIFRVRNKIANPPI